MMMTRRPPSSILALSVEAEGIVLCRARLRGDRLETTAQGRIPVAGDLLRIDPAAAGAEIKRRLAELGIRRETCVVCLPPFWAFTFRLEPEDELTGPAFEAFLEAEVERRCPVGLHDLCYALSTPEGTATPGTFLAAVPREHLEAAESALRAAGLRPVSMTLKGLSWLEARPEFEGLRVVLEQGSADLLVALDGRVRILRNLEWHGAADAEEGLDAREIARQVRLTLGRLTAAEQARLSEVRVSGPDEGVRAEVAAALARLGLTVHDEPDASPEAPEDLLERARLALEGVRPRFELQPRRLSRMQQAAERFSARRTRVLVGAALATVVVVGGALMWQHRRLSALEARWADIEPRVTAIRELQDRVRKYRSWYDDSIPSLSMARDIVEAFPAEGSVWVRALEFKDRATATCTGNARTRSDWMEVLEKLQRQEGIQDVNVVSSRGDAPLEFTLTLRWNGSGGGGQ